MNLNEIITVNQNLNKPIEERNLLEEVQKTLQVLNLEILESGVTIKTNIPPELIIHIIPAYLDSILLNLIGNAVKYRKKKGKSVIKITAKALKRGEIRMRISDNGLGIDMRAHADKIFGMYKTFHDNEDARGFGLYITKNQIEAMKGRIEVDSELGKGTTFYHIF